LTSELKATTKYRRFIPKLIYGVDILGMKRILIEEITKYIGEKVKICGWVDSRRDHGKIIFIDLRDVSGLAQIVFAPNQRAEIYKVAQKLRTEWVIEVTGRVDRRPKGMENPKITTGKVEIGAENLTIFSEAKTLPFETSDERKEVSEEIRLKYRYLDLRRKKMKENLTWRYKVIDFMRNFLKNRGFIEIETPILTKSTPEGARDFIVPSRLQPGKFYALPQSPQQYKQLLMVAGFEKYFQIARCFRDEDPRADRQAEFTQLDIEMAFVEQDDILSLTEELYSELVKELFPQKTITQKPFPRISFEEAMERYKTDKPDLRRDKSNPDELAFGFVVNFPMFEWRKEEGRWDAVHHPFTRPNFENLGGQARPLSENIKEMKKNPDKILAFQYDFILNGFEIGGGSLRTYKPEILEAVFEVMGHKKEDIQKKFGHLLKAFEYGAPPHGGIAPGIDRFMAILMQEPNIREVIAFPKTGDNRDLMMEAPSEVDEKQLKELRIGITKN